MQPGAIGGAGHHQVDQLAGCAVADAVHAVTLAHKGPLLLGLVLVLAQADIAAVGGLLHGLNDTAALGSDGIEAICLDHGLRYSFHVNPSKFVSFEPIIFVLQVNYTTCCYFLQGFRHFFSTIHKRAPLFSPFCTVCENFSPRFAP